MTQAEHMRIVMAIRGEASEAFSQFFDAKAADDDAAAVRWLKAYDTLDRIAEDYYEQKVANRG